MKEKFLTKGNISLLTITFLVTLITAIVACLCGGERMTVLFSAPCGGILSILLIGGLYEIADMKSPMGPEAGILGVVLGEILAMIFF